MLNEDQQKAVDARNGQFALIAGPGSGKTTTLVARYKALIAAGVPKTDIMCLTFTREAAESMMKRASGNKEQFATFHSLGYRICRMEKGDQPVEPELRHRLLCKLSAKYGLEYKAIAAYISACRRNGKNSEQEMEEGPYGISHAYNDYEKERLSAGWMDFDSMLVDALELLEKPDVQARWQFRFPLADEMQDSDTIQWRIMQLISEKWKNVMVVGDPGQSIYAWRDAHPEYLTNFEKWFPQGQYIYLGRNYRSTHTIVGYVRQKYPIETPLKEKLLPARLDLGEAIQYKKFLSDLDEAEDTLVQAQKDPKNSAILARTNRGIAHVENLAIEKKIPYTLLGHSGFWKQSEVLKAIEKLKKHMHLSLPAAVAMTWAQLETHYLAEDRTKEDNDAWENLLVLREISRRFSTTPEFIGYANRCAHAKRIARGVTIGTVHAAKGLEWTHVFLIGCREGMMPHSKSLDFSEERRIFFVAVSRPIDRLRISWTGAASPFLKPDLSEGMLKKLDEQAKDVERLPAAVRIP